MADPSRTGDPQGERQYDPDRELVRAFGVGCGLLFLGFLCGWAAIAYFWLS